MNKQLLISKVLLCHLAFVSPVEASPKPEEIARSKANKLIDGGNPRAALPYLNQAIALSPALAGAYVERARVYDELGEYAKSLTDVELTLRLEPRNKYAYFRLGSIYSAQKKYTQALKAYNQAVLLDPKLQFFYTGRANLFLQMHEYKKALADADTAIAMDKTDPLNYFRRAGALEGLQRHQSALADYTHAIEMQPRPYFLVEKITLLLRLHRFSEAAVLARRLTEISPNEAPGYFLTATALTGESVKSSQILFYLNRAIALNRNNAAYYLARAELFLKTGDYHAALKDSETALAINANDALCHFRRGQSLVALKRYQMALRSFTQAIYVARGKLFCILGDYKKAIADDNTALELQGHQPALLSSRGELYGQTGDFEQVVIDYNKANSAAITTRKIVGGAQRERQLRNAVNGYSTLLRVCPVDQMAVYNRALAYLCLGNAKVAAKELNGLVPHCSYPHTKVFAACCCYIAYKQCGEPEAARKILDKVLDGSREWPFTISRYLAGQTTADDVLLSTRNPDQRFRSKCYIGANLLLQGNEKAGYLMLKEVVAQADPRLDEYTLAESLLARQPGN